MKIKNGFYEVVRGEKIIGVVEIPQEYTEDELILALRRAFCFIKWRFEIVESNDGYEIINKFGVVGKLKRMSKWEVLLLPDEIA